MKLSDFHYDLPGELIAQHPADQRSHSRMLVLNRKEHSINDCHFYDLPDFIDENYFIVVNDSKVFKARLLGQRATGAKVKVLLVRRLENGNWIALLKPSARIHKGEKILIDSENYITAEDDPGEPGREISFVSPNSENHIISTYGKLPLPPYIKRDADEVDDNRYQTVYAQNTGSVAAPTAGLHFDEKTLARLAEKKIAIEQLTLHVGPGTFKSVTTDRIEDHTIDPEFANISETTAGNINEARKSGKKLLAVGTTCIRTLEAISESDGNLRACNEMVNTFIYPPYKFKAVDALITNFHLPDTSLMMLISAFYGREFLLEAYRHAVAEKYRFYSYGDCMLIL
ncbi:MAG: tRNA preQ1(34) S-adenosylmethionine ribosyltransferase-isomerase QueA [candidate division Zixibacteria bacterium]|nr:tRNA preQ1(34) S-adenosylmethionine ribosyltransferase-isomerase QueA [candidate division Zixibacteria bacterium]